MKKMFTSLIAALAIGAMSMMATAQAQTIPLTYKAANGTPFSVKTAQKLVGLPGSVNVIDEAGFPSTYSGATLYTDSSYQVYGKITNDPDFLKDWIQLTGQQAWANTAALKNVTCYGNKTTIVYRTNVLTDTLADNCQFYSAYQARTNN